MTVPEPTAEHIDAVALLLADLDYYRRGDTLPVGTLGAVYRERAGRVLTSTDPAVHAAMLDALVRAGVLTWQWPRSWTPKPHEVTPSGDASRTSSPSGPSR